MSGKPWFRARPELREGVEATARELQPELYLVVENDVAYLRGTYLVNHDGGVLGRYEIEIEFPHAFPDELPIVRETGEDIPRVAKRHMYPDGRACLFLEDEFWWRNPEAVSFRQFLDDIMQSFFISQTYYVECEEVWLFGEHEHNATGTYRFYSELLEIEDIAAIHRFLDYIERGASGHWDCPCGSGERVRDCHRDVMWDLKDRIPPEVARRSRLRLEEAARRAARDHQHQTPVSQP